MTAGRKRVSLVFGTRPEAIKLAPVVLALRDHPRLAPHVCVTGQHRHMLDQVLSVFGVVPNADLDVMTPDQGLAGLSARLLVGIDDYLARSKPDLVLVQGDTTTALCASLAAFYRKIPAGHVEAGLRTSNRYSPFPEEMNRVLASRLVDLHFAPTSWARDNLLREGEPPDRVFVTGNTVIDALQLAVAEARRNPRAIEGVPPGVLAGPGSRLVLVTGHRRENFGPGFEGICRAIRVLAARFEDVAFVYPVHLNPNVRAPVFGLLGGLRNVHLLEPVDYLSFVALMDRATVILTDSGGVQEEAPSLGKPVLVMRDTTERPEVVEAGAAVLVGTDSGRIVDAVSRLLTDPAAHGRMARATSPYGDGTAARQIVDVVDRHLSRGPVPESGRW
jgi:UDP-N-acetylglucosamine 2-epimerase (non-hydrolysing)